jgi:hypothetical protein
MRYTFSAAASAFVLPMIHALGVGWTNTFSAGMVWVAFGLILLTIRYGEWMRRVGKRWEGGTGSAEASGSDGQKSSGDIEKAIREEEDSERTAIEEQPQGPTAKGK